MCHECMPPHPMRGISYCGCRFRGFLSSKEEMELLENYRDQLRKEIAGVEERIKELKQKE
ncbi:MAG: DUF5320 domain-containing protein [Candidatus Brockarchaeota archaeon]|nr:DUF5320 domain-containing protein [Candidatus Brockarchaeota archaeon]